MTKPSLSEIIRTVRTEQADLETRILIDPEIVLDLVERCRCAESSHQGQVRNTLAFHDDVKRLRDALEKIRRVVGLPASAFEIATEALKGCE